MRAIANIGNISGTGPVSLAAAASIVPLARATETAVDETHAALLQDRDLKFDFSAAEKTTLPDWLVRVLTPVAEFLSLISPLLSILFWGAIAATAAIILIFMAREIHARLKRRSGGGEPEKSPYQPERSFARALLEEADALAADGSFDKAVHVLLFKSIEDINEKHPNEAPDALTSREIADLDVLHPPAREAFGAIAAIVERMAFAGQKMTQLDFDACRDAYRSFALAERAA
ncbi:MAG: hypothetical protein AAGC56_03200 [Pseudomonadota bacterium]